MRASQWLWATLKDSPNDAELISHKLMLRAGMIRQLGSGLYTWLPLGLKVLRKLEQIVREEMQRSHALEILMPAVQPEELWNETGRWTNFGNLLLKLKDNNGRSYCFGPTHEEVITDLARRELHSYKQLPINFYQIQTKFRDEIRPRFGVMRAREFIMKDAYSFHLSQESLQETYDTMYQTYGRILDRLNLRYRAVEADTGAIGGNMSHEFQVLADAGEDLIFYSDSSDYAANIEQATALFPAPASSTIVDNLQCVETPNCQTIAQVANFFKVDAAATIKTLLVVGTQHPVIALILRGDDELNTVKASKHPLIQAPLQFADEATAQALNLSYGYLGPIGLDMPIIVDHQALAMTSFICGANVFGQHYIHASWGRDATYTQAYDLRNVKVGDPSPDGKGLLRACRGIEVGHVFQLGSKYAKDMQATVINEAGQAQTLLMGCYGFGISRIVAATIEQHHDQYGIVWPLNMAPFQVVIIPINGHKSPKVAQTAEELYQQLLTQGYDVLLDDRNERPGVLFAENDLIGIPHRLVVSERNLALNLLEYKARNEAESRQIPLENINDFLYSIICNKA